jgi:hypothetical protein
MAWVTARVKKALLQAFIALRFTLQSLPLILGIARLKFCGEGRESFNLPLVDIIEQALVHAPQHQSQGQRDQDRRHQ